MSGSVALDPASQDRVLVTGGAGFLGRALVRTLMTRTRCRVTVLALLREDIPAEWASRWRERITVVRGDITRASDVECALGDSRWCFHLAALVGDAGRDEDHQRITVGGTATLFEAARRHGTAIILVTSICAYGDAIQRGVCREDTAPGVAQGPYGRAKQGQEALAHRYRALGVPVCIVRPANIIGPGSGPWVVDAAQALRQGLPALIGGGHGNAALAGVDNVADFLVHAAAHPAAWGQDFHIHDDLPITWQQYFGDLAALLGTKAPTSIPRWAAYAAATVTEPVFKRLLPGRRPPVTREALNLVGWDSRLPLDRARSLGWQPTVSYDIQRSRIGAWLREQR